MKLFVAAVIATLAAAEEWTPKDDCLAYLDERARWLAKKAGSKFYPHIDRRNTDAESTYYA